MSCLEVGREVSESIRDAHLARVVVEFRRLVSQSNVHPVVIFCVQNVVRKTEGGLSLSPDDGASSVSSTFEPSRFAHAGEDAQFIDLGLQIVFDPPRVVDCLGVVAKDGLEHSRKGLTWFEDPPIVVVAVSLVASFQRRQFGLDRLVVVWKVLVASPIVEVREELSTVPEAGSSFPLLVEPPALSLVDRVRLAVIVPVDGWDARDVERFEIV